MMFKTYKVKPHVEGVLVEKLNWVQRLCVWFAGQDLKTYRWGVNPVTNESIWFDGRPPRGWYNVYTEAGDEYELKLKV